MDYRVTHRTTYRYLHEVSQSQHLLHLAPRATAFQSVTDALVTVTPNPVRRTQRVDYFGNTTEWLALLEPHMTLDILSESHVTVTTPPQRDPNGVLPWEDVRLMLEAPNDPVTIDAAEYLFNSPSIYFTADLASYALKSFMPRRSTLAAARELMARVHKDFRYDTTVTDVATPVDRVFQIRAGVCQDLAHVMIACLRAIGLPARYVSGYLLTLPPPGRPRLVGADASHAWLSVWCPPIGWIDFDPTNNLIPGDGHVTVAWGRDYSDVAPINGLMVGGGDHVIEVGVDVVPQ